MSLDQVMPLKEYVSPAAELYILRAERALLTVSDKQNEDVGGKDDPDNEW